MENFGRVWLLMGMLAAAVNGQSVVPVNETSSDDKDDGGTQLRISEGDSMVPLGPVLGLTDSAKNNIPPPGISGPILLTSSSNTPSLRSSEIAMISCDPPDGFIDNYQVFSAAVQAKVSGILFYTETSDSCHLEDYTNPYKWIYSIQRHTDTVRLLNEVRASDEGQVYAKIGPHDSKEGGNGDGSSNHDHHSSWNNQQGSNPLGPSPSTAVAMIILYSITGLITALFLCIIVTGAVRAHRHPERYGPRNVTGRPRQSRAKGVARAMLDTLPIVKFGGREEPKPTDVELADNANSGTHTQDGEQTTEREAPTQETSDESQSPQRNQSDQNRAPVEGGIAAAIDGNRRDSRAANPDHLGCSICTEDFQEGQDQRVLPCDHRFHPGCIDPWLLNVSGTCPLCRIDLQPQNSETGELDEDGNRIQREGEEGGGNQREGEADQGLAPPLGPDETAGDRQRMSVRRSIMIGMMGVGRPDRLTREERVAALRNLRGQQGARERREEQAGVAPRPEEERRTRWRLRDLLGIRRVSYSGRQEDASAG